MFKTFNSRDEYDGIAGHYVEVLECIHQILDVLVLLIQEDA